MVRRFEKYFERLEGLSPEALDHSAERIAVVEKENVARLIAHIAEMSRRKVALELGYKNLFDYCVRRLRLSEGSVALRLQVANAARKFPALLVALAENRMSLTVAGLLAPRLTEDNTEKLLSDCEGMTKRDVDEYLVAIRPKPEFKPSVRRVPTSPRSSTKTETGSERTDAQPNSADSRTRDKSDEPDTHTDIALRAESSRKSRPILEPARPEVFNFRFAANQEFKEKFERLAEVLGVENAQKRMAEIFEQALDAALDKKDPKKKLERRKRREHQRKKRRTKSRPAKISRTRDVAERAASRYVASEGEERVFERAGYRCEYRARDGTRCMSRTGLQIEHSRPYGIYRSHDERFLRAYCPHHNRFAAERTYGTEFIQRKIDERRARAVS